MKEKLAPRYIRPFEIIRRVHPRAYKLVLPLQLDKIYNVFHVSLLKNAEIDHSRVLPQFPLEIEEDLTLKVKLIRVRVSRNLEVKEFLYINIYMIQMNIFYARFE